MAVTDTDISSSDATLRRRLMRRGLLTAMWPFPGPWAGGAVFLFTATELSLLAIRPCGFWFNGGLSRPQLWGLAGLVCLNWAVLAWLCDWYFRTTNVFLGRTSPRLQPALRWGASGLFVIAGNLYLLSWLFFWQVGTFPDWDVAYFGMLNAGMLGKYFWQAERESLILTTLLVSAISLILLIAFRRNLNRVGSRDSSVRTPGWVGLLTLLVAANAAWFAIDLANYSTDPSQHPKDKAEAWQRPWPPYGFELRFHVNPAVAVLASVASIRDEEISGEIPASALVPVTKQHPPVSARTKRPTAGRSIIVIVVESLRSDVILKRHQNRLIMPHLAELARGGRFFPNCYAQSTHSDCADPCIVSSLYPLRSVRPHYYRRTDPWPKALIYDVLKQHGYATSMFSSQNEAWSNMHLFYESPHLDLFFDSRAYEGPTYSPPGQNFDWWRSKTGLAGKLDDRITVDKAVQWIGKQQQLGKPFFALVNLQASHFPYVLPDGGPGPFQPAEIDFPVSLHNYPYDKVEIVRNAYYNAISYVDRQMGRLLDFLDASGLREQTVLLVVGDHGEAFYENGVCGHAGMPLETTTKVGLVVNCPGGIEPGTDDYLAQAIDIAPTALALVGVPAHPAFQGQDLLSSRRIPNDQRLIFTHANRFLATCDAVVSGCGWKYLYDWEKQSGELYYRPTDLEEHPNLAASHPAIAAAMQDIVAEWRRRQLLYYARPRYYNWFYAPRAPRLDRKTTLLLKQTAK